MLNQLQGGSQYPDTAVLGARRKPGGTDQVGGGGKGLGGNGGDDEGEGAR